MPFFLSLVLASDADTLVRKVEYPANQDNPLYCLMFPSSDIPKREEQLEAEIRWMIESLTEALSKQSNNLRKACREDGRPVGIIEWVIGHTTATRNIGGKQSDESKNTADGAQAGEPRKQSKGSSWFPETLDVATWFHVSDKLRKERERVLQNHDPTNTCRITIMSVDPTYQRLGIGSMLLQFVCNEVDQNSYDAFVIASPAGVRLYTKFGFKAVGAVETHQGKFTSMLRKAIIS